MSQEDELNDHHQLLLVRLALLVSFLVSCCAWHGSADQCPYRRPLLLLATVYRYIASMARMATREAAAMARLPASWVLVVSLVYRRPWVILAAD